MSARNVASVVKTALVAGSACIWLPVSAAAQSVFDRPTDCDLLAAHPFDPERLAVGVPDEDLIPRLVIEACEREATSPRTRFQLGRGYLAINDRQRALQHFRAAAESDYAIAHVLLGDAAQFGWAGTVDQSVALSHYRSAKRLGVPEAETAIAQVTYDPSTLALGRLVGALVEDDIDTIEASSRTDLRTVSYLYSFTLELAEICGPVLEPDNVAAFFIFRFPAEWEQAAEEADLSVAAQDFVAIYDAGVFTSRHGCAGIVFDQARESLNALFARFGQG